MLGCYRKGEAEDPDTFLTALVSILMGYPESVVIRVTDPRTGIPGSSKFLPTIADVRHECEVAMAPIYRERERVAKAAQAEERERKEAQGDPQKRAETLARLKAAYPGMFNETGRGAGSLKPIADIIEERKTDWSKPCGPLSPAVLKTLGLLQEEPEPDPRDYE